MNPASLISFLRRYWRPIVLFVVINALSHSDTVTFYSGPTFYLFELAVGCIVGALFLRHLFMRRSLDAYAVEPADGDSDFVKDWRALDPSTKVFLSLAVLCVLFLGCALIAASIAK